MKTTNILLAVVVVMLGVLILMVGMGGGKEGTGGTGGTGATGAADTKWEYDVLTLLDDKKEISEMCASEASMDYQLCGMAADSGAAPPQVILIFKREAE
ncbi:MAG TPA: hypothetical protein VMH30_10710 [Verrucomicrobiae bacterium]|nr:hypothetical protein [Verrucomicrobiae bacterium]